MGMTVLDLECPFPWPGDQRHAEREDREEGSYEEDQDGAWLQRRYAETLWLGEQHSPLSAFLQHMAHLVDRKGPSESYGILVGHLKIRSVVKRRYHEELSSTGVLLDALQSRTDEDVEKGVIRHALSSGPAIAVAKELRTDGSPSSSSTQGKWTKRWLDAIEARELEMQMLLVLFLLWLSAEHPSLASAAMQKTASSETAPTTPGHELGTTGPDRDDKQDGDWSRQRKRKRKAQVARRWNGSMMAGFPWGSSSSSHTPPGASPAKHTGALEDPGTEPETLNRRFEALVDAICLCVVTSSLLLDLGLTASMQPTPPSASRKSPSRTMRGTGPLFGSAGRPKGFRDERDEVQWLCSDVVEPFFSDKLPRQCRLMRSKCYVAGSGSTPARPTRTSSASAGGASVSAATVANAASAVAVAESEEKETDLVRRHRARESAQEAQRLAREKQRPGLVEALERERQRGDAKSAARNTASRAIQRLDAREVSVRRRWERAATEDAPASGRWARSTSVPNNAFAAAAGAAAAGTAAAAGGQSASSQAQSALARKKPLAVKRASAISLGDVSSDEDEDGAGGERRQTGQPQSQTLVMATPQKARKMSASALPFGRLLPPPSFSASSSLAPVLDASDSEGDDDDDDDDGERVLPRLLSQAAQDAIADEADDAARPADDWKRKIEAMRLRETRRPFARSESQPVVKLNGDAGASLGGSRNGEGKRDEWEDEVEMMVGRKRKAMALGRSAAALLSFGSSAAGSKAAGLPPLPPVLPTGRNPFAATGTSASTKVSPAELGRAWRGAQQAEE